MFISIIIGFRNREIARVERAISALSNQSFKNFELIFIDYGSEESIAKETKALVTGYNFAKYIYSDTRGWFWNRAHALNTGIKFASGQLIVFSDVDLILPDNFLEVVNKSSFNKRFYTFNCYYLKEEADYSNIIIENLHFLDINYVGLCAVLKEDVIKISCYNEYYMNWGGEDDDLYIRLENEGCKKENVGIDRLPVLHQWHSKQSTIYPTPWYLEIIDYLYSGGSVEKYNFEYGLLVETSMRSILKKIDNNDNFAKLELFGHSLFQFNLFLDDFFKMGSGEFGQFEFPIQPSPTKGRKQIVIERFNSYLSRWNFPYSIEKKQTNHPINTRQHFSEFVMYFIGKNRSFLEDYYLIDTTERLVFYFRKK